MRNAGKGRQTAVGYIIGNRLFAVAILVCFLLVQSYQICTAQDAASEREIEVRQQTEKILSGSEFTYQKHEVGFLEQAAKSINSLIDKIKEKIKQLFKRLSLPDKLPDINNPITKDNVFAFKLIGVCILSALIILMLFILLRNLRVSRTVKEKEDAELLSTLKEPELVILQAVEYSKSGDQRLALRFLYIGLLLKLNEFNLIKISKSKVNRQYISELKNNGFERMDLVLEFTNDFNRYWYGNRNLNKEKFEYWLERYTSIKGGIEK